MKLLKKLYIFFQKFGGILEGLFLKSFRFFYHEEVIIYCRFESKDFDYEELHTQINEVIQKGFRYQIKRL